MNESWHICEWVMAHIRMSHGTRTNESWHTHGWAIAHTRSAFAKEVLIWARYRHIHFRDMTHSYMCHDPLIWHTRTRTSSAFSAVVSIWRRYQNIHIVTSLMYTQPVLLLYVFAMCVCYICLLNIFAIYMCAMTHSYVCHDSFTYVPWLIHVCHDSFMCVRWLIHVCAMTHICLLYTFAIYVC